MRVVYDYVLIKFLHRKLVVKYYSGFGVQRYNFLPKTCKMPFLLIQTKCILMIVSHIAGVGEEKRKRKEEGKTKAWRDQFIHSPVQRTKQY